MSNIDNTSLTEITAKQVQFCNGLKAIIDGDCSLESLGELLEELCDIAELIDLKAHLASI